MHIRKYAMTQSCEGKCVVRCCAISLGPSADVFYMRSKPLIGPPGQRHRAQVINMPRLMSSPSIAFAPLTRCQYVCMLVVIHLTIAAGECRPSQRAMPLLQVGLWHLLLC